MSRHTGAVLAVCVVAVVLAATSGATAAGAYGIDSPSAVDVPDQTVMGAGEFLTVREIARVERGEPFEVDTTAPADATYEVELRGMYGQVVAVSDRALQGEDSATFETASLQPGSYVAVLVDQGTPRRVLPVVVEGYGVTAAVTDTAEAGAEVTVSADLTPVGDPPDRERVEVVVVDRSSGEMVMQKAMTADRGGYSATIGLAEPGEYGLCVNVRGERTVRGYNEILGFSDAHELTVTEPAAEAAAVEPTGTPETDTATAPATTSPSTTVPEGVITRNPTDDGSTPGEPQSSSVLSVAFALLLALGLGLLYWARV